MIPADLGAELAAAIGELVAAGYLPGSAVGLSAAGTWRPVRGTAASDAFAPDDFAGSAAARYATSLPFELARLAGQEPGTVAARLGRVIQRAGWITSAEPTGTGYLTIGVTAAVLSAVAVRTSQAGPACVRSDALQSVGRPVPPLPELAAAQSWRQAWWDQAAALAGRLAEAAGATALPPDDGPPTIGTPARNRAAGDTPAGDPAVGRPAAGDAPARDAPAGRSAAWATTADDSYAGKPRPAGSEPGRGLARSRPAAGHTVADAVEFAGADAVRYWLARLPAARAGSLDRAGFVTRDPARPCIRSTDAGAPHAGAPEARGLKAQPYSAPPYLSRDLAAVRFAAVDAAATGRWAAELGLARLESLEPGHLGQPAETALLTQLSWLAERVAGAARRRQPHELPRYLERLAGAWLDCRENCPALPFGGRAAPGAAAGISARLWLAEATATALAAGLDLVGVPPVMTSSGYL